MTTIPCKRPKVTVEPRTFNPGEDRYDADCHVPGCSWTYPADKQFMALKTDADGQATRHRQEHRGAVPGHSIGGPTVNLNYFAECICGWKSEGACLTRTDNQSSLDSHLRTAHGLVVCR